MLTMPDFISRLLPMLTDPAGIFDENRNVIEANRAFTELVQTWPTGDNINLINMLIGSDADRLSLELKGSLHKKIETSPASQAMTCFVSLLNIGDRRIYFVLINQSRSLGLIDNGAASEMMDSYLNEQLALSKDLSPEFQALIGEARAFRLALYTAQRAAKTDFPVLILGESGTGKEVLARTLHKAGKRKSQQYVDINCAAIPDNLIESELFGYERGAFTGAHQKGKAGLFEIAHQGSIFLDEIGDASMPTQAKLLRVLDEGHYKRVGGISNVKVDVRVISATNKDLPALIKENLFREDLYYRLNTISIKLPPLRERQSDIPLLVNHFLAQNPETKDTGVQFTSKTLEILTQYDWPGNVRELKGVVEYAVTMATGHAVTPEYLPLFLLNSPKRTTTMMAENEDPKDRIEYGGLLPRLIKETEKNLIKKVIAVSSTRSHAIKTLGISRRTFYSKLKEYDLE